ncbi:hypothetical protein LOK49_LG03G02894 [Camellia lanceoleosa]|uniref:Uncharacterized protein n=1 Tax=Camellia lanceoleosa TaxID=1840588 RepID=A0ACC0ICG9_9ERIC|nr:hypothetical protein LOK49_LG03G02894 [Camellia lanceoleosa]
MENPLQVQLINGISNKKLGKEEELDVKVERLKEQLKQVNVEKSEMTSKYEKLSVGRWHCEMPVVRALKFFQEGQDSFCDQWEAVTKKNPLIVFIHVGPLIYFYRSSNSRLCSG